MALEAVTFDFWSTLVDGTSTPERTTQRMARLQAAIAGAGYACTPEDIGRAFQRTIERVDAAARETYEDVGPPGRWAVLAAELGVPDGLIPFEVVERAYEDITLAPLPDLMPHVHSALEAMQRAGYRLAVICNTGMAGGRVLRQVLKRYGLFEFFQVTVFSNEFGYAKPDPRIFGHTLQALGGISAGNALHVGDLEELDVEGARRAGLYSARYVPGHQGELKTDADLVVTDWRNFGAQIQELDRALSA